MAAKNDHRTAKTSNLCSHMASIRKFFFKVQTMAVVWTHLELFHTVRIFVSPKLLIVAVVYCKLFSDLWSKGCLTKNLAAIYTIYLAMKILLVWGISRFSKKHPTLGVWCAPPKYFSEFYKLFLGFYKSQFSGTTYVSVEKCLLLVYGLFKNLKNLTFVMFRCHKTLNGAICIQVQIGAHRSKIISNGSK